MPSPNATTLRDAVQDALLELGVLGITDPGEPGLYEVGLRWANRLIDQWNANHDAAWAQEFRTVTLPAGKNPVTIGPVVTGSDPADLVVAQRPVSIESCRQRINNSFYPVRVQTAQWYRHQTNPLWTGTTQTDVYYEPDWPNGHLFFYPIQSGASVMVLETRTVLSGYAMEDEVTFPPGGVSAFVLTLAESLQGPMRMALSEDAKRRARVARTQFTANNREIPYMSTRDFGLPGGRQGRGLFNYKTGRIQR
jgi:hypothetical protein